jgi:hypothetical protein
MHFGVHSLREIDDINELITEAGHTVHMLVNEASERDKYDMLDYINQAEQVLDLLRERIDELSDDDDE